MQVREGYLAARRGAGRRVPKEGFQIRIQRFPIGVGQIDKAERLHPSLGRPHGKQHLRLFSNRRCSDVKNQLDFQLLVQRFLEMDDSAGGRKLMESRSHVPAIRQANQHQHRAAQLHAKRPADDLAVVFSDVFRRLDVFLNVFASVGRHFTHRRFGLIGHWRTKSMAACLAMSKLRKNKTDSFW